MPTAVSVGKYWDLFQRGVAVPLPRLQSELALGVQDKKSKKSHKHKHHKRSRHASPRAEASPRPVGTPDRGDPADREGDRHTPPSKRPRHDSATPPAAEEEVAGERRRERGAARLETDATRGRRECSPSEGRGSDAPSSRGARARSGASPPAERGDDQHGEREGDRGSPHGQTRSPPGRDGDGGSPVAAAVDLEELRAEARRAQHHARASEGRGGGSGSPLE